MSFLTTPDGYRLRYAHRNPSAAPTIVLVHGWKGSHRAWDPAVYRFARAGYRVIAFDNRGMGESDKPVGNDAYDFDVLAEDLSFVLSELDARDVTLVGWSMGCTIALQYLQRGGDRAAKLVLVNGPISLRRTEELPWAMTEGDLRRYIDEVPASFPESEYTFAQVSNLDKESRWTELYYFIHLQTPLDAAMRIVEEQTKLDFTSFLPQIRIPTLALYGAHDPFYPRELATWIAEHVQDGRALIFEDSSHPVHFDEPDRFVEVVGAFARDELRDS